MTHYRSHFRIGRMLYGIVPIVAGLDKFTNLLTDWSTYLSPTISQLLPVASQTFMYAVGVIEIIAGLIVLSPLVRTGALIVGAWLVAIALNLIVAGYFDIAVRDLVMAAGAFHLSELARAERPDASVDARLRSRPEPAHS